MKIQHTLLPIFRKGFDNCIFFLFTSTLITVSSRNSAFNIVKKRGRFWKENEINRRVFEASHKFNLQMFIYWVQLTNLGTIVKSDTR